MKSSRILGSALLAAAITAGASMGTASAAGPAAFHGTCTFPKTHLQANSPAGSLFYRQATVRFTGGGTCSGDAGGAAFTRAHAGLDLAPRGGIACLRGSDGALRGPGTLSVAGASIKVNAAITIAGNFYRVKLTGSSGRADGRGATDLLGTATQPPLETGFLSCPFEKFDHAVISLGFATSSPLVSLP